MNKTEDITMNIKMNNKCFVDINKLDRGEQADENQIIEILDFINGRYDCSDFRMVCIIRSLYSYNHLISEATLAKMKKTVVNFKYWMDEPGDDSMCYWSENHQLLFATCEYLAGQLYPDEIFTNNGMSGREHLKKAEKALNIWLKRRFEFGFIEWHSNTYYEEDIAPLSLLIDFCDDNQIVKKATIMMDLLLLDLALHSYQGFFCATSGRCYEEQKKNPYKQDVLDIIKKAFGFNNIEEYDFSRLSTDFILNKKYILPKVIYEIAHCNDALEIKDSMGLDLKEIQKNFKDKNDIEDAGMFMWAMEAFTNAQSINQTIKIFNTYNLKNNIFLKEIDRINIPIIKKLNLLPIIIKVLNPVTQGIAIQRANTYTYKTKNYMLSTAQKYHPQEFGDQQHIWQAILPDGITVFTTHPGVAFFEDNARNFSPSYWVGNAVNPHSVQYENIGMSIYNLKIRKGFMEKQRPQFTHAYFPLEKFDEVIFDEGKICIGRKKESFIALLSINNLQKKGEDELIQKGKITAWTVVTGSTNEYGTFEHFVKKIKSYNLTLNHNILTLKGEKLFQLKFKGDFKIDGVLQNTNYKRFENKFVTANRRPKEIIVEYKTSGLELNFDKGVRYDNNGI